MKTLELSFLTSEGKTVRMTIDNPKEPLEAEEVKEAMQTIIDSDVFIDRDGYRYQSSKGARLIERNVTVIDLD